MSARNRLRGHRPGQVYDGRAAWVDNDEGGVLGVLPGYYALAAGGKGFLSPMMRLVCVDDAPGDALDDACHFVVARKGDPTQASAGTRFVGLSARMKGTSAVNE